MWPARCSTGSGNRGYDPNALFIEGEPPMQVPGLDITPALRDAVLGGQPLFQGPQGATEFTVDGKAIIRGFESANISTALHELFPRRPAAAPQSQCG